MSPRGTLKPLTLLLLSLLCYGFVMVWTEKATLETLMNTEEPTASLSPVLVNILTGGNLSVSVSPGDGSSAQPSASAQVDPTTQSTTNEDTTSLPMTSSGVISSLPTTIDSLSTGEPTGGTGDPTSTMPAVDETSTTIHQSTAMESLRSSTAFGTPHEAGSCKPPEPNGSGVSSENCTSALTSTIMADNDIDTVTASTGLMTKKSSPIIPRVMRRNTSGLHHDGGGRMSWRVKLRSRLSQEKAITALFEQICDVVLKIPHMRDVLITWGPDRTEMKCLYQ